MALQKQHSVSALLSVVLHLSWMPLCVQITVDGDTSTNDTVIGLASGKSGAATITDTSSKDGQVLEAALTALLQVSLPPVSHIFTALPPTCLLPAACVFM
jgi:N-acetylglutamate synthase/N-acetylornithine aminotransferase